MVGVHTIHETVDRVHCDSCCGPPNQRHFYATHKQPVLNSDINRLTSVMKFSCGEKLGKRLITNSRTTMPRYTNTPSRVDNFERGT